jgi:hypothetical protein
VIQLSAAEVHALRTLAARLARVQAEEAFVRESVALVLGMVAERYGLPPEGRVQFDERTGTVHSAPGDAPAILEHPSTPGWE